MTTVAKCSECGWSQEFTGEDHRPKAKNAASHHLHEDANIKKVDK